MWNDCTLEGDELAAKASSLLTDQDFAFGTMGGARELFHRLVTTQQIFLDPPKQLEWSEKRGRMMQEIPLWRATVSARVRTYPNKHMPHIGNVGRGEGTDPVTAALRAVVASFGPEA